MGDFLGDLIGRSLGQTTLVKPRREPFFAPMPQLPGDFGPTAANVLSVDELGLPGRREEDDAALQPILVEREAPKTAGPNHVRESFAGATGHTTAGHLSDTGNDSVPRNRADMTAPSPPDRPVLTAPQTAAEPPVTHAHIRPRSDTPAPDLAAPLRGQIPASADVARPALLPPGRPALTAPQTAAEPPATHAHIRPRSDTPAPDPAPLRGQIPAPEDVARPTMRPRTPNRDVDPPAAANLPASHVVPGDLVTRGETNRRVVGDQGARLSDSQLAAVPDLTPAGAVTPVSHSSQPVPRPGSSPPQPTGRPSPQANREGQPESMPVTPARRASNRARAAAADGHQGTLGDRSSPDYDDPAPPSARLAPLAHQPAPAPETPAGRPPIRARASDADAFKVAGFDRQPAVDDASQRWVMPAMPSPPQPASTTGATANESRLATVRAPLPASATREPGVTGITLARPAAQTKADLAGEAHGPATGNTTNVVAPTPPLPAPSRMTIPDHLARVSNISPKPEAWVDRPGAASEALRPAAVRTVAHADQEAAGAATPVPPTINVTIGRIEVRAMPPPATTARKQPAAPVMTLDEYMKSRSGGRR